MATPQNTSASTTPLAPKPDSASPEAAAFRQSLLDLPALVKPAQIDRINRASVRNVERNTMLFTLTRTGRELFSGFEQIDGEGLVEAAEMITDYQTHLEEMVRLCEAATARLLWVGTILSGELQVQQ